MSDFEHTPYEPEQDSISVPSQALLPTAQTAGDSQELFQSWSQPRIALPTRIPHFGHLCMLAAFVATGFVCATVLMLFALHFHLFGAATLDQVKTNVHYILGFEAILYLVAFSLGLIIFPLL